MSIAQQLLNLCDPFRPGTRVEIVTHPVMEGIKNGRWSLIATIIQPSTEKYIELTNLLDGRKTNVSFKEEYVIAYSGGMR